MSPRRRLFAIGLLVLAAGLVAAAVLVTTAGGRRPVAAVPQDRPGPVLVVPGYGGGVGSLGPLVDRLRRSGRPVSVLTLPGGGVGDLRVQAQALGAAAAGELAAAGARSVDVVGYSAGGVVARLWVKQYGGAALARRVVTIGSPHHGTDLAALAGDLLPGSCPTACQQLAPGSSLLAGLNAGREAPAGPQWTSLWSARDEVVMPPQSAVLAGATDVELQAVCPTDRAVHGELPADPLVIGLVLRALGPGTPPTPVPADCAALRALGR